MSENITGIYWRHSVEFQEENDSYSWRSHTRGKWTLIEDDSAMLEHAINLQRVSSDRKFRVVTEREEVRRIFKHTSEDIRRLAGLE